MAAPAIAVVRRAALPMTPAADYLCDMFRRASADYVRGTPRLAAPKRAAPPKAASRKRN